MSCHQKCFEFGLVVKDALGKKSVGVWQLIKQNCMNMGKIFSSIQIMRQILELLYLPSVC